MKNYFALAEQYYDYFYSIRPYMKIYDYRIVLTMIFAFAFIFQLFAVLASIDESAIGIKFLWLLVFELGFLISQDRVTKYRKSKIIEKFNPNVRPNLMTLDELKRNQIQVLLGEPRDQFILNAEKLDKLLILNKKYRPHFNFSVQSIAEWIYSSDSKARVITLLVFLASAILLLTVREELTISSVYEFYNGASSSLILSVFLIFVVILSFTLLSLGFAFRFFVQILSFFAWRLNGSSPDNLYAMDYLVRDLIKYHEHSLTSSEPKRRNALLL